MRKFASLITSLFLLGTVARAQLYDNTWVLGNRAAMVHFDNNIESADTFPSIALTGRTWASICDKEGELKMFTSGFVVYDKNGDTIPGAFNLCDSLFTNYWYSGLPMYHGALIIPKRENDYYIFYCSISDDQMASQTTSNRFYYATVYFDQDGTTYVTKKNLLFDQNISDSHLIACKHANGRDWWVVINKYQSNEYLKYLVTANNGILGPYTQAIGTAYGEPEFYGQIMFSPDGSKFAGVSGNSKLNIFDFDRCTGEFSNPVSINIAPDTVILPNGSPQIYKDGGMTVSFSPNNQYLYLGYMRVFWQFDLLTSDIATSRKTIWKWKNGDSPHLTFESFLTPTGKILIGNWSGLGDPGYSIIMYPDVVDTGCSFQDSALYVKTANHNYINNTFNYRLGPLTGSTCDTINDVEDVTAENSYIKITPNPATDKLQLSLYKYLPNAQLLIADELGRVVYENRHYYLDEYLDISQWQEGIYFVKIYNAEKALTTKFVKE